MPAGRVYRTPQALRTALEARLAELAKKATVDVQRLRRRVAFDRFLARLFAAPGAAPPWHLKGGYALEVRLRSARATNDIDLSLPGGSSLMDAEALQRAVGQAALIDLSDGFAFIVGQSVRELTAAPESGHRFPVQAIMAERLFSRFQVDIGIGDDLIEPIDIVRGEGWFDFADLPRPEFHMISREQQFAEKLHAYTLPRTDRENTRVKDLVELILLIQTDLEPRRLRETITRTFARRNTHPLPATLAPPPLSWQVRFDLLAQECGLAVDVNLAFHQLAAYVKVLE